MTHDELSRLRRLALGVAVTALALTACGSDPDELSSSAPSASSASSAASPAASAGASPSRAGSPVPTTPPSTAAGSASPQPAAPQLQLNGDDLLATRVGAPYEQAVLAVSSVLGPPAEDPAQTVFCIGTDRDVAWDELALGVTGGVVVGWTTSEAGLAAPSGVRVGSTVATLKRVYGDRLQLHPFNPDAGHSFSVDGVDFHGGLSGPGDEDRVVLLWNGACGPP